MSRVTSLPSEPPSFFRRGLSPLARLTVFGLASVVLMFIDGRFRTLEFVRSVVATVLHPIQQAALLPSEALEVLAEFFESRDELRRQNELLRAELLLASQDAQAARAAQAELAQLQGLLLTAQRHSGAQRTRVLYPSRDPFSQKVFIERTGKDFDAGVAVIDERGLLGQVTRIYPLLAELTLITEKDFAVPVRVERTGMRAILFGRGPGKLPELRYVPSGADLREGDILVTAGGDGVYPPHVRVATVEAPRRERDNFFMTVEAVPIAGLGSAVHVLVLPRQPAPPLPPTTEAEAKRKTEPRARR
ncbi:MAG: rod shape-determining protein MreC [Casimicrobiaceae bacterium]|nr:rod shape-determining protein MreC [Casimicrobiaceae bacterium]MCX8099206.1 rod shape-determining protein MreC [Casimicrobiaceae bacterium]MDW8311420.1 rod shape-determining protein MreC [Burkholderiales bacterium]